MRRLRLARHGVLLIGIALGPATASAQETASPPATAEDCLGKAKLRGQTFASGSAEIVPEAKIVLDLIAGAIQKRCDGRKITIEGYTDARGSEAANQALSEGRAEAVKAYLVSKGVPAEQLGTVGYGESRPLSETDDALNRRVTFVAEAAPTVAAPPPAAPQPGTP